MLVTLDWTHAETSLNRSQAVVERDGVDADGVLRVVVSTTDPGVANWMDTTGYRTGVVQCREIGSVEVPELTAQVVPLASLRDHLPPDTAYVTPEERAERAAQRGGPGSSCARSGSGRPSAHRAARHRPAT